MFLKDSKGSIFSTDLILTLFLFILILGIVANITDSSNEKIINPLEIAELERLSGEVVDNLINNPGTPSHWEKLSDYGNVRPGLAIENNEDKPIINTISYEKIKILENNQYNSLIGEKIFNKKIKSSIAIYPIDCEISPIIIGDKIDNSNVNISNIVVVNRTIKCDFYNRLAIVSMASDKIFTDLSENSNGKIIEDNGKSTLCNHKTINNSNHSNIGNYYWICKEFRLTKKDLENKKYYLLFDDNSINNDNYWILDNTKAISTVENSINREKIDLNTYFDEPLKDEISLTFYLHLKINKNNNKFYNFNSVLVGVPEDIDINSLNIDYFKEQECYFIMKTSYA